MAQTYFAIFTAVGEAKDANAKALGIPMVFTEMAVGDGNGLLPVPDRLRTTLVNQVRRAPLNQLSRDPVNLNQVIAEQVIPENVGGWWVREIGLYDADGDLIAIANCPPTYKPQLAEGSGRTQVVRMVLIVSSADTVQLKIDPAVVLATRKYADDAITASMTAHLAALNPHPQYVNPDAASQEETDAGVNDTKFITAKKLKAWSKQATETVLGLAKVATQAEVNAGTDDTKFVTSKKLRFGFSMLAATNGYIAFPSWLGGFIIQWGIVNHTTQGQTFTFPVAFPHNVFGIVAIDGMVDPTRIVTIGYGDLALGSFTMTAAQGTVPDVAGEARYIAIGN